MGDEGEHVLETEEYLDEDYRIWKKNVPYLYDLMMTYALEWPSLTTQWFPSKREVQEVHEKQYTIQSLLLGTHTTGEPNYLMIADVRRPIEESIIDLNKFDSNREIGGFNNSCGKIDIKVKINHDGDVNMARYMPQNPSVIATKSSNSDTYIFDYTKHPSQPRPDGKCIPEKVLKGHSLEGFGLDWNPIVEGLLLSSSKDGLVCSWDIRSDSTTIEPLSTFKNHEGPVEDVSWHKFHQHWFGTVGCDRHVIINDCRTSSPVINFKGHDDDVNCIAFHPQNEYLLATASSDKTIGVWDIRNTHSKVTSLKCGGEVFKVEWHPTHPSVLVSSSESVLNIWDLSRTVQSKEGSDVPPELLFIHKGHTNHINDFDINWNDQWVISTVSEDNVLQIWQLAESAFD